MEVKIGDTHCEITTQHLEYGAIIGGRRMSTYTIMKMLECTRGVTYTMLGRILKEDYNPTSFMKWQQIEFFPEFYAKYADPLSSMSYFKLINRKMKLYHYLLAIGNTSLMVEDVIVDFEMKIPLFAMSGMIINIDPVTRQPAPFPKALKDYLTPERCENHIKIAEKMEHCGKKLFDFQPAGGVFHVWECIISVRLIDHFNHANQATYVDICYDCLGDAFAKSVFGDTGPLLDHDIRRLSILYLKEMTLSDKVVTTVWKDRLDSPVFKFHMKKNSVIVCQVEIELFQQKVICDFND